MRCDSLETWRRLASPKSPVQWQDHRSAKECARAWLGVEAGIPRELRKVLRSHDHFGEILESSKGVDRIVQLVGRVLPRGAGEGVRGGVGRAGGRTGVGGGRGKWGRSPRAAQPSGYPRLCQRLGDCLV